MIQKIISGGQTGADIAGIDAAIGCNVPYGGWLPKGRKTVNGPLSERYTDFQVMTWGGYPQRTEQNVIESDGTVIFTYGKLAGGLFLTKRFAVNHNRPWLHIDLDAMREPVTKIIDWIIEWDIKILNIAGKSGSKAPEIHDQVKGIIRQVLEGTMGKTITKEEARVIIENYLVGNPDLRDSQAGTAIIYDLAVF